MKVAKAVSASLKKRCSEKTIAARSLHCGPSSFNAAILAPKMRKVQLHIVEKAVTQAWLEPYVPSKPVTKTRSLATFTTGE
jgi:hypothetical protein